MSKTIAEIQKNPMEKIIATLGEFKGKQRIDIRVYYQPDVSEPDIWKPTKKGINLDPGMWQEFKELIGKIDKVLDHDS